MCVNHSYKNGTVETGAVFRVHEFLRGKKTIKRDE